MDAKMIEKTNEMIDREISNIVAKNDLDKESLHCLGELVDISKDMAEIEMSESGYSQRYVPMYQGDPYMGGNSYNMRGGNSYRNNNMSYRGNSYRNSYNGNGGYSRGGDTMSQLQRMMDEAQSEQERNAIQMAMNAM